MRRVFLLCSLLALVACAQPAPPPPVAAAPPPPPPPPPEHNFTVFFDWDRANITSEGRQIVEAAESEKLEKPPRGRVMGRAAGRGAVKGRDQSAANQLPELAAGFTAAEGIDFLLRHRLAVGDDR